MTDAFLVLALTSAACALPGVFLLLRNLSMMADAISHTVLLGIVLAFFLTHDLSSPWLLFGAALMGVVTVMGVELLGRTKALKTDDAIGVLFPMLFSLAVILISKYAGNVHLDTDMVLMGEVIYAGLDTVPVFGHEVPAAALKMGGIFLLNAAFIALFYKELKLSTFDEETARLMGMATGALFYGLMTLISLTTVAAFDAVGSILVISFFIAPAATALLFTKRLHHALMLAILVGVIGSAAGCALAVHFNASMSGMCALVNMVVYLVAVLCHPKGVLTKRLHQARNKARLRQELLLLHIGTHTAHQRYSPENEVTKIAAHLRWKAADIERVSAELESADLLTRAGNYYLLTEKGEAHCQKLRTTYLL
ncbi:MAG: metal ABC transporter permease [Schwartzia sp. (in: firmicutes)]